MHTLFNLPQSGLPDNLPSLPPFSMNELRQNAPLLLLDPIKTGLPVSEFRSRIPIRLLPYLMEKSICFTTMKQMKQYVDLPDYGDAAVYPSAAVAREMEALVETLGVCAVQVVYDTMKNQTKTIPAHSTIVVVEATSVILFQPHYTGDLWSLPAVNLLSKLTSRRMRSLYVVNGTQTTSDDCAYRCIAFLLFYLGLPPNGGLSRCQARRFERVIVNDIPPGLNICRKLNMNERELVKGMGEEFEELVHSVGLELDEIKKDAVRVIEDPPYDPKMDD
ncbi:hypothetical protein BDR26DRAFT_924347 [Obelidium mucronatum]|nr:hypothetical protein BDR26DRAFT_924347 [Obelidium mucronatum]